MKASKRLAAGAHCSRPAAVKQLLGLACSMANLNLAAPSTVILHTRRFSCSFAGIQAQSQFAELPQPLPQRLDSATRSHSAEASSLFATASCKARLRRSIYSCERTRFTAAAR